MTTATSQYSITTTLAGRYLVALDGRQIAECKTSEAAQRVIDRREADIAANARRRDQSAAESRAYQAETERLIRALDWSRVRKVVSREPGYAVACLGAGCESVLDFWGAPFRTCIVLIRAGYELGGNKLSDDDRDQLLIDIDCDDETRDLVTRHSA